MKHIHWLLMLVFIGTISCEETIVTPKPKALLSLDYPKANYRTNSHCSYSFLANENTNIVSEGNCSVRIDYPELDGSVFITYKPVHDNIRTLLRDAQKLTDEHTKKAASMAEFPFINMDKQVFGMLTEVGGNAASSTQFYATDSLKNFILGSVYFNSKPNYDSIYPAIEYIREDVAMLLENLEWVE